MVALVRGVHGLHGAVRVEVLTDRPDDRFVPGAVLYREGDPKPLTLAGAEAVADGPGWRLRFREITSRDGADTLRGAYLEAAVRPDEDLARGAYYWHEVIGVTVRGVDGADLGTVQDVYRVAENEVFIVGGGPYGSFDLPAVRAFIRIFAPRRGEIVVDADALDLQVPRSRAADPDRPKAPRRRSRRPAVTGSAAGSDESSPATPATPLDPGDPPGGQA
ncbi:MAG: 16S rRNA processing protein RimM [Chloroflexi bacterium]|nr:16S rRNA processing protein RimM [Chloroflexota bacterium]